jgi:pSer/pThr/pTyr-binding forkhead associated (FHA) protein
MSEHAIVHLIVRHGPRAGDTISLGKGDRITVGRGADSTFIVGDDMLSRRHFEVSWDGESCRVLDLESSNGTEVNGVNVSSAKLEDGDTIIAGRTAFQISVSEQPGPTATADSQVKALFQPTPIFESVEPAPRDRGAVDPADGSLLRVLLNELARRPGTRLFALVDGARDVELAFDARQMGSSLYTVFSGEQASALAHVGPVVVTLDSPMPFLERWVDKAGAHVGVLFQTPAGLDDVCAHLRDIFVVTDEEGQEYFFRFYDPRVLRTFLPTCTPTELSEFFTPITRWICEDEAGTGYVSYELDGANLVVSGITTS